MTNQYDVDEQRNHRGMPTMAIGEKRMPKIARPQIDWPIAIGRVGIWCAVISFGGVLWAVNGGFSVAGLRVIALSFNEEGAAFWRLIAAVTFRMPVQGGAVLPLLPWLGVLAASALQIIVIYLQMHRLPVPVWMLAGAIALSAYDLASTFTGLGTVEWIQQTGWGVQAFVTVALAFGFETAVGLLLKR